MRICVIGAAGRTGRHLVGHGVAAGHQVTAVARSASRIVPVPTPSGPGAPASCVHAIAGAASDPDRAARAVHGQDAVICAIAASGTGRSTDVSDVIAAVVTAMAAETHAGGQGRLVMTSSRNLVATEPRVVVTPIRWLMRHVYADLERAEDLVRRSALDWTVARATRLSDERPRGSVWTDQEVNATGGDWRLPRSDYARALLDIAEHRRFVREVVGINGARRTRPPP